MSKTHRFSFKSTGKFKLDRGIKNHPWDTIQIKPQHFIEFYTIRAQSGRKTF
jgi:hypothetical protein